MSDSKFFYVVIAICITVAIAVVSLSVRDAYITNKYFATSYGFATYNNVGGDGEIASSRGNMGNMGGELND